MRKHDLAREVVAPRGDGFGETRLAVGYVSLLGVHPDDHLESVGGKLAQEWLMPKRRALRPRWVVAGLGRTGITKSHGDERNNLGVVELGFTEAEPAA